MELTTDKGCFNISLKLACLWIAGLGLLSLILNIFVGFHSVTSLVGLILAVGGNLGLLFGALRENQYLVLVWLAYALLFFIGWPIMVLGIIFNFGDCRHAFGNLGVVGSLVMSVIALLVHLYMRRIVYPYFKELREGGGGGGATETSVV